MRGFRAVYLGLFFNVVIMASVNLAAAKIANVLLGWPMGQTLLVCGVINVAFRGHLRPVGRAGHRLPPVRHRHGRFVRGGRLRAAACRKSAVWMGSLRNVDPSVLAMVPDLSD